MKIFISWSGSRSGAVAQALRDWLQDVIQALDPWMSEADIEKGARWSSVVSTELDQSNFGIICLTRDNLNAPWLLFEAGALSKLQHSARVCTFLLDVKASEVQQPLAQFQSTTATKEDVFRLIETINKASDKTALEPAKLKRAFERTWEELNIKLKDIAHDEARNTPAVDRDAILNEILGYVRSLSRDNSEGASVLTTQEIIELGEIFSINLRLSIVSIGRSSITLQDGTHGTTYKLNRRALGTFLQKLRAQAKETSVSKITSR